MSGDELLQGVAGLDPRVREVAGIVDRMIEEDDPTIVIAAAVVELLDRRAAEVEAEVEDEPGVVWLARLGLALYGVLAAGLVAAFVLLVVGVWTGPAPTGTQYAATGALSAIAAVVAGTFGYYAVRAATRAVEEES